MKTLLIYIAILGIGMVSLYVGLNKHEQAECMKWLAESTEHPEYYFTRWQNSQCEAQGIELPIEKISRM